MGRRRGSHHEVVLHADAQRLLAEADYPASVKQTILLALRGGRPGKQQCLVCRKPAQHCQFWVPPELTSPCPTSRRSPPCIGSVPPTMARCPTRTLWRASGRAVAIRANHEPLGPVAPAPHQATCISALT